MDNKEHIGSEHFGKINRSEQTKNSHNVFHPAFLYFFFEICPQYMNKIYKTSSQNNIVTRSFSLKLSQPVRTKALTQKSLPYLGQLIWNGLPDYIKLSNNANMLKDKVKRNLLALLQEKDQDIYIYHG